MPVPQEEEKIPVGMTHIRKQNTHTHKRRPVWDSEPGRRQMNNIRYVDVEGTGGHV